MATPPNAPTADTPRFSKLMIGLLIGASLLAAGAVAYVFLVPKAAAHQAEAAKPAPEKPIFVALEPFTVNLQGEGRAKFLHVGMALKVHGEPSKAQITEFMPELRSRALMLLSNRSADSLVSPDDKARLAEEIRSELNRPLNGDLPEQGITSVAFNTFVVQ